MLYIEEEMKNLYLDFKVFCTFCCSQKSGTFMLLDLFEIVLLIVLF